MTIQHGQAVLPTLQTIYLQADRKRVEFRNAFGQKNADGSVQPAYGPRLVAITRCDLGKARGLETPATYNSDKPTLRIEVTTTDTGERKEIFGHIARHVVTTRKQIPLEGSHSEPQDSVTDAWYIDFQSINLHQRLSCDRKPPEGKHAYTHSYLRAVDGNRPMDKPEFVTIGEPETGFALHSVTTSKSTYTLPDGARKQSDSKFEMQVTQFEEGPLDPALFEIPSGFKHVEHIERNQVAPASSSQISYLWQRLKASVAGLFSR